MNTTKPLLIVCFVLTLITSVAQGKEFHDLTGLQENDSWLALDTWNHIRVAEFIGFISPEFPECTLDKEVWKERGITGAYLKTQIWEPLTKKMLKTMRFKNDVEKLTILGFPEDETERKEQIKLVRQRIDAEWLRRNDHKFRTKLLNKKKLSAEKSAAKKKAKARQLLNLDEGEFPTPDQVKTYKVKKLRALFDYLGVDPSTGGNEKHDMQIKALQLLESRKTPEEL
eukprot:TRINITY_DN27167_c0_g1_i1.p1 TRINITY_DN27167_c0_g1~~TRINITY_DN27167_c0_g1_i1.p1  ORF type:complete len:227 (+),score=37.03 TRINITY_DN27167_c0_g1_i1:58-738(+)